MKTRVAAPKGQELNVLRCQHAGAALGDVRAVDPLDADAMGITVVAAYTVAFPACRTEPLPSAPDLSPISQ
jgi:hypothetical protein